MEAEAPAPPIRWRSESREIGGFYTFLKSEVDKLKAAEGKMRTHAMKQCNVLLKEYVSFNPYVQRLYFEHIQGKKYGDSRYPQAYRCSMRLRSPSVWDSSPPMVTRRPSSVGPNHVMSETSSTSGYQSSDHTRARIVAKTPKPERGRKKSPDGSHNQADTTRNPERETGKTKSPVLIRYRSPDSNPERPSQGSPYRISEGSPYKYRKAGSHRSFAEEERSFQRPHKQALDNPSFARVTAMKDMEVVAEVSRFLPGESRSGSRMDVPAGFSSSGSSEQSIQTPGLDLYGRPTGRTAVPGSSELSTLRSSSATKTTTLDGSNAQGGIGGTSTTTSSSSSSMTGIPLLGDFQQQHRHSLTSSRGVTSSRTFEASGNTTASLPARPTSTDAVTGSSERTRDRLPGTKEVSFESSPYQSREGGVSFQDEGTQTSTYSDQVPRPGYASRYGSSTPGGVSPPRRSDPEVSTATSTPAIVTATATATVTATATTTAATPITTTTNTTTRSGLPDQQHQASSISSIYTRTASSPGRLPLPGGGIYTYKVPAGGSYRLPDHAARLPEAKLVEGSTNVYVIEDATQYRVSEGRISEHVPVGQLLYGSQTRLPEAETRSRTRAGDGALRLKRKKKKFPSHRCDVSELVPEQRRVRRRSTQNRIPETRKYMFYKYYGFAGQGAKTSWGHNRPLGLSPPHAHKAPQQLVDDERPETV